MVGWNTGAPTGIELIPLIHRAVASVGAGASWSVEAALAIAFDVVAGKITTGLDRVFRAAIRVVNRRLRSRSRGPAMQGIATRCDPRATWSSERRRKSCASAPRSLFLLRNTWVSG